MSPCMRFASMGVKTSTWIMGFGWKPKTLKRAEAPFPKNGRNTLLEMFSNACEENRKCSCINWALQNKKNPFETTTSYNRSQRTGLIRAYEHCSIQSSSVMVASRARCIASPEVNQKVGVSPRSLSHLCTARANISPSV